jgi:3-hydroxybutyrate dehydrogenase
MSRTVAIGGVGPTLGASFAGRFTAEGDGVTLWARSDSHTTELAAELADTLGEAVVVEADVTDPEAVADAVETVNDALGTVDVHVHNTLVPG